MSRWLVGSSRRRTSGPWTRSFANCQALAPTARQRRGSGFEVRKARAAERLGGSRQALSLRHRRPFECGLDRGAYRFARRNLRNLGDAAEPGVFAYGHVPAVRFYAPVENLQQSRFARAIRADQADAVVFGHGK